MSIFANFADRAREFNVEDKSNEYIVYTRRGKTGSATVMNNEKQALLQDDSLIVGGDVVTEVSSTDKYIILAIEKSTDAIHAQLRRVNALIKCSTLKQRYNTSHIADGYSETVNLTDQPSYFYIVSANMHLYDPGLLSTTTCKFITKQINISLNDRITYGSNYFKVDHIDNIKYPNLYEIQCSTDTRAVK